jgi:hypothetical protein
MISTEDCNVERPMNKTLARHPLVLLDQQLKNLANEDDMPDNNRSNQQQMRCWTCDGTLRPDTTIDLHTGFSFEMLLCLGCGRRWRSGEPPRPVIAA